MKENFLLGFIFFVQYIIYLKLIVVLKDYKFYRFLFDKREVFRIQLIELLNYGIIIFVNEKEEIFIFSFIVFVFQKRKFDLGKFIIFK